MSEQISKPVPVIDNEKVALNKRLETMFWGLFLIMLGGWAFIKTAPNGLWSIGVGLILLGLNAARYFNKIKMSGFTTVLGILALIGGFSEMFFKMDWMRTSPWRFRSSGTRLMPFFMASCPLVITISCPSSLMVPCVILPYSPNNVITSSVRPDPINPAMPRISPFRRSNETPVITSLSL